MRLFFPGPAGALEGELWEPDQASPRAAVAFCHPHPSYGGTMQNTVVYRCAKALQSAGLAVLRFNFRGVERSEGRSEASEAEEGDLAAALDHLARELPEARLWAGGFSFGARVAAAVLARDTRLDCFVLVSPPCRIYDCSAIAHLRPRGLIATAENDEFGNQSDLLARFPNVQRVATLREVPATDHFYGEKTDELGAIVLDFARTVLNETPGTKADPPR
jgi:alpha/beta superfamily hydrolase